MNASSSNSIARLLSIGLFVLILLGCGNTEEVAEPTPRPVEVAPTIAVAPTDTPEPIPTPESAEPTPISEPTIAPILTIDPENDGTQLKVPVMQDAPIKIEFDEIDGLLVDRGLGPIAPASSVSFTFMGYQGQTFKAQVEGGTFGNALFFNGSVLPISLVQGRAMVWELTQGGEYTFSLSNGGTGANYSYEFSLTKAEEGAMTLAPQRFQFGQGVTEKSLMGETTGSDPIIFLFNAFEGQTFTLALDSESSRMVFINATSGETLDSAVGSATLQTPPLPNTGEYRIEVSSDSAEPFELTVTLLP